MDAVAGGGRGAVGGVGAPGEGVPTALVVRAGRGGAGGSGGGGGGARAGRGASGGGDLVVVDVAISQAALAAASGRGGGGGGGLRGAPADLRYVVASDGVLHAVGQAQGKELKKPIPFLPANANATELVLVGDSIYTSTINGCGGVANGVWAVNMAGWHGEFLGSRERVPCWSNRALVQRHTLCGNRHWHRHVSRRHRGPGFEDSGGERLVVYAGTRIFKWSCGLLTRWT